MKTDKEQFVRESMCANHKLLSVNNFNDKLKKLLNMFDHGQILLILMKANIVAFVCNIILVVPLTEIAMFLSIGKKIKIYIYIRRYIVS